MKLCLFLLFLSYYYSQQCNVCHQKQSFTDLRSQTAIKRWLNARDAIERKGHIWISATDLRKHQIPVESNLDNMSLFYDDLTNLAGLIKVDGGSDQLVTKFTNLMNRGSQEVPAYEYFWREGRDLMQQPYYVRKRGIHNLQQALEFPFLHLYLRNKTEYKFSADSRTKVSKVLLFFGGFQRYTSVNFNFFNEGFDGKNYRGTFSSITNEQQDNRIKANYSLSTRGDLVRLAPIDSRLTATTANMAGFLSRGEINLKESTGKKTIYLGRQKGLKKDKLDLEMKMHLDNVVLQNEIPLLKVRYDLREIGDDRGDRLNLSGSGEVLLGIDGLMHELASKVIFQVKVLNIGLIKGLSEDNIKLTSVVFRDEFFK